LGIWCGLFMGQFLILCEMYFISLSGDPESPYQQVGGVMC
jgi:hypothetical protein